MEKYYKDEIYFSFLVIILKHIHKSLSKIGIGIVGVTLDEKYHVN